MKVIENYLKNLLLRLLLFFNPAKGKHFKNKVSDQEKILFIRLNRIGDALVVTPLLHEVRKNIKAKIYLLADKKNYMAFNNNPDIDELLIFNKGIKGFFEIRKLVRNEGINTFVDAHDDVSTTVSFLVALTKASNKFALEKDNKNIYTKTIKRLDSSKSHVVDRILELAKLFNINPDKSSANIHFTPNTESFQKVSEYLLKAFQQNKFLIGINISAGSKARFWGIENYKRIIAYLKKFEANLLLLCSPNDKEHAEQIAEDKCKIFYSEKYDEFGAMISKLNFLITPDTAAVHLASVFKIPVFGIYVKYKTNDMIWSPYKSDFECIITDDPNLEHVDFKEVLQKLKPFIEKYILSSSNVSR